MRELTVAMLVMAATVVAALAVIHTGVYLHVRRGLRVLQPVFRMQRRGDRLSKRVDKYCRRGRLKEALETYAELKTMVQHREGGMVLPSQMCAAADLINTVVSRQDDPCRVVALDQLLSDVLEVAHKGIDSRQWFGLSGCILALLPAQEHYVDTRQFDRAFEFTVLLRDLLPAMPPFEFLVVGAEERLIEELERAGETEQAKACRNSFPCSHPDAEEL